MSQSGALSVDDLVAGYSSEVDILNGVSVRLAEREIVAVVGPNGAGKSTLLKAIVGLVKPKRGESGLPAAASTG
jgi:ABC-type Mn2+/Zn2+ transport system ATPase subunit